jgi:hypothetical protein
MGLLQDRGHHPGRSGFHDESRVEVRRLEVKGG